jgi:iron complex outermembrane receptor protein
MKRVTLLLALAICGAGFCFAQEEDISLDKIVVTSSRTSQEISETASNITVIAAGQIQRAKAKNIPELLNAQAGVLMRDYTGNGKTTNADMRGFGDMGANNILVLVDGRRINNIDSSNVDWTQIPLSRVEKIEILRGAGSVLYGDNASGGVINIITKEPPKKPLGFRADLSGGSYGSYGELGEVSFSKGGFSALGLFEQYRTDGYRINSGLLRNDASGKAIYALNPDWKASFSFANHKDKYGMPGGLKDIELNTRDRRASVFPDDWGHTRDWFVDLGTEGQMGGLGKIELSLARRKRDSFANLVRYTWITERNTVTDTVNIKYLLDKMVFSRQNKLTAGFDYLDASQDVQDGGYSGNPDKLALAKKNYGFYLFDQLFLLDKVSLDSGWRHDIAHYNSEQQAVLQGSEKSNFKETGYTAAINYNYAPGSNIYATFGNSFRLPLVDEIYTSKYEFFGISGGGLNAGLGPQTAKNYEIGIRHSIGKTLLVGVNGYLMKVKNEIYYEPSTVTNTNYGHTVHRGAEFSAEAKLTGRVKLYANYAFTDALFEGGTYDKRKIPAVPPHRWGIGGDIRLPKYFIFSLSANYVGERYFINDQENILPRMGAYFVADAKLSFEKGLFSAYLAVNNLFDEEYYEYGAAGYPRTYKNYYPANGTNFTLGASVKF